MESIRPLDLEANAATGWKLLPHKSARLAPSDRAADVFSIKQLARAFHRRLDREWCWPTPPPPKFVAVTSGRGVRLSHRLDHQTHKPRDAQDLNLLPLALVGSRGGGSELLAIAKAQTRHHGDRCIRLGAKIRLPRRIPFSIRSRGTPDGSSSSPPWHLWRKRMPRQEHHPRSFPHLRGERGIERDAPTQNEKPHDEPLHSALYRQK